MNIAEMKSTWLEEVLNQKTILGFNEWKKALAPTLNDDEPFGHTITLDLDFIAKMMKEKGVKSTEDNWTNTLMDILEDQYGIETVIRQKMFRE
jgi:hypothetical protein